MDDFAVDASQIVSLSELSDFGTARGFESPKSNTESSSKQGSLLNKEAGEGAKAKAEGGAQEGTTGLRRKDEGGMKNQNNIFKNDNSFLKTDKVSGDERRE